MKKTFIVLLLLSFSISVLGCTNFLPIPHYRVSTSGFSEYGDSAELSSGSSICVIENSGSPNPLLEREIKFKIVTILKNKGYQIASFDNADFYLLYAYGIGPGQTVTDVHSQTYTSHKLNIHTGQIETITLRAVVLKKNCLSSIHCKYYRKSGIGVPEGTKPRAFTRLVFLACEKS